MDLNIFKGKNHKVLPLKYSRKNSFHTSLYNEINNLAQNLNVQLESLLKYKTEYAPYDHGVVSASLLFQVIAFNNDLKDYCEKNSKLPLAQNRACDFSTEEIKSYAQCIFSVLLHNIYNKKSDESNGIEYSQNIDKDPFSYFCAFCDTIQRWGRPKKIDHSETSLPDETYLEDEFDIYIYGEKIYINCIEKYMKSIKNMIYNAEKFLPGMTNLIKVISYENE